MTNLSHDTENSNATPDASEQALGQTADQTLSAETTAAEQKFLNEDEAAVDRLVDLTADTLDPKDMLKKYAKLGFETLKIARKRKASFKAWDKGDFESLCAELERKVKLRVAIKDIRMATYVRVALWIEAVKPAVPGVEKLSYFQVANKFLPTLQFDAADLTGELRKEWHAWTIATVSQQLADDALTIKELDESIAARKAEIERERAARKDPEKALEQERKAAEAKSRKDRKDAQSKIADSIDKAIVADHANEGDVVQIVEAVLKDHGLAMPKVGFNPADCTTQGCKMLADTMYVSGKLAEMKYLRDRLDAMIKMAENAMITTKTA